ncbi:HAD family hydrolase [Streptomyces venezuelae]|uniref:HAD family hydrolase n=1 Tax=Streptomyces venezuelae TaxID=54571 RepID=UPI00332F87E9
MEAVLFDMFGVIAHHQSPEGRARLAGLANVPEEAFWTAYWGLRQQYDRGDVTGQEYWGAVAEELHTDYDDARIPELIEADLDSWSGVDTAMVELIEELAASGRRIALLSNIPEELAARYQERHPWLRCFETLGLSCRIGWAKPEPGAYLWSCLSLDLDPEQILFVDDRAENIAAAEQLGMHGHLFAGRAPLRAALAARSA